MINNDIKLLDQKQTITAWDIMFMRTFKCCFKDKHKYDVLNRCLTLLKEFTQVENVIKNQIEVNFLRKLLLTENQNMLFKFIFRSIDFENPELAVKYLDDINEKHPEVNIEKVKQMSRDNPQDKYLLNKFNEYMSKKK